MQSRTPHKSNVLNRISKLNENYPANEESKLSFIINSSKILQAAHLLEKKTRTEVLNSMIKVFDELLKEILIQSITETDPRIKKRTILEFILWGRRIFYEFFCSTQFSECLNVIRENLLRVDKPIITDITEYCIAYCIALNNHDSKPLYDFLEHRKILNPRWFKIVGVDVKIKNLSLPDKKISTKFKTKAVRNKEYVQQQFKEILSKHYNSITGME